MARIRKESTTIPDRYACRSCAWFNATPCPEIGHVSQQFRGQRDPARVGTIYGPYDPPRFFEAKKVANGVAFVPVSP